MLDKVALTKPIQNYCKWASKPENINKINTYLPIIDSAFVSTLYAIKIKRGKQIPEEQKNPQLINVGICFVGGALLGGVINKMTSSFQNNVIKHLAGKGLTNINEISAGIKTITPLIIISFLLRYLMPVLATPISVSMNNYIKKHSIAKNNEVCYSNMDEFIKSIKKG